MNIIIKYNALLHKSVLCLLYVIIFSNRITAQEYSYVSFPDSGAIWSEVYCPSMSSGLGPILERFALPGEDTVINSLVYKKLFIFYDTVFNRENAIYVGGIREDSLKRVYFKGDTIIHEYKPMIDFYDYEEVLFFDFSVNIGDTIQNINCRPYDDRLIVQDIDTIEIGNLLRKRIYFWPYTWVIWIEGIGNVRGLLFTSGDVPTNGLYNDLICFKQNDTILYFNEDYSDCIPVITGASNKESVSSDITVYPNPVTGSFIRFDFGDQTIVNIIVLDCQGRVMEHIDSSNGGNNFNFSTIKYPPGIYFFIATNTRGIARTGKFVVQ